MIINKKYRDHLHSDYLDTVNSDAMRTATILGKQVNHIKVIQNRAIAKLRQALGDSGAETGLESNSK